MEVTERIIVESGILFSKYGIRSMTMDALAEEMGISKRTIYERFKDKDTLLLEVIKYLKEKRSGEAHRIIEESENAIEAFFRIIKKTVQQIEHMNPIFFHDFRKYHAKIFREFSDPGGIRDYSVTLNLLETGVQQKVFRSDIHIEIVNGTLHELFNLFGVDSNLAQAHYSHKELFEHIIMPYFRGISTKKGISLLEDCKNILG
ncbi:MAG: TetR/AcrR family transcriptional regulator [Bacteroidota bacterium]